MNDKELADKVVAILGNATVAEWDQPVVIQDNGAWMGVVPYVRDWRVAGALMEKAHTLKPPFKWLGVMRLIRRIPAAQNLPRAIIEACVGALS